MARQIIEDDLDDDIRQENEQGQHEYFVVFFKILGLGDLRRHDHRAGAGDEDNGADRDHSLNEDIAEHLEHRRHRVGNDDPENRLQPRIAHQSPRRFPRHVDLRQGSLNNEVRRRKLAD